MYKVSGGLHPQFGRRQLLQLGVATTGAGLLSAKLGSSVAQDGGSSNLPRSPHTTPFVVALPIPELKQPVAALVPKEQENANVDAGEAGRARHQRWNEFLPQKFYELRVMEALHSFHPELPTQPIWGYDGKLPGPTFVAHYGEPALVRIYNDLPLQHVGFGSPEITTHLHNGHTASESDGFPADWYSAARFDPRFLSAPGRFKDHHYPNIYAGYDQFRATNGDPREAMGTLWYHDHREHFTAQNVYKGLAGFYLLFDDIDSGDETDTIHPNALRLPSGVGVHDIPLVFQDKQFDSGGYLFFDQFNTDGILGDKFTVNGKVQPFFEVERRKYRFRLLDGGPSRFYEFYLSHQGADQAFTYIANDGNLLPAPLFNTMKVRLGVAERADIVIDFAQYPLGSQLFLVNRLEQVNGRGPTGKILSPGTQILRFDVVREPASPDMSRVPATLRALPPMPAAVKTRTFRLDRSKGQWTVNGEIFNPEIRGALPQQGTAEIWVFHTNGNWSHPNHVHFEEGRILSRNGKPPPPHEGGRKDVFVVGPGEEVRVLFQFRDFVGKYPAHCHNLIHEDDAMMARWDIVL